ncbi:MAG: RNA polymerase sigma factor [Bacteroidales bacterium]|nr:RNA polymerase sigma factor [Bacteroidales bacterium]MBQ1905266.1 RNA polymerase sigma factor [Bacteroidales bacterium]MBQ2104287.1 RNA polymerase sigma factor [Bacteroidales bacterium]MBQ2502408.1 RNA polymerase sigma factor [Bacteroidales bacterium]MBQ3976037.1 RNA polymerase sigma factor [Bacteroidales bacterium]
MSDRLLKACIQGDRKAQRKLYEQLAPKMFPVCLRYMNNREMAEDVMQDGFVTLFSKLDSYSGTGSFEGWARKIFVNTALMQLRRNDVLKESDNLDDAWDIGSPDPSAIQEIGHKELLELIAELPPGFRTVFNMYVIEGYSHKEIADELGISENTSRSQLQRARVILQKKILEKQG